MTVAAELRAIGRPHLRVAVADLEDRFRVSPCQLVIRGELIDQPVTVFWRGAGLYPTPPEMREEEAQLVTAEAGAIFQGAFAAVRPRWVHHPATLLIAANKVHQLLVAKRLNIGTPTWLATSDKAAATEFVRHQQSLAKAVSSGPGLRPYARAVTVEQIERAQLMPTMFQHVVDAAYDVRLVTVGADMMVWRRQRADGEPLDWREGDARGTNFVRSGLPPWHSQAFAIARALDLTVSIQDWLESDSGEATFLEVNTRGAWLFLDGGDEVVTPVIARHLASDG